MVMKRHISLCVRNRLAQLGQRRSLRPAMEMSGIEYGQPFFSKTFIGRELGKRSRAAGPTRPAPITNANAIARTPRCGVPRVMTPATRSASLYGPHTDRSRRQVSDPPTKDVGRSASSKPRSRGVSRSCQRVPFAILRPRHQVRVAFFARPTITSTSATTSARCEISIDKNCGRSG